LAGDSAIIFRKLLQLRLLVLAALLCFLWLLDTLSDWPVNYPVILIVVACGIGWSLWLLSRDTGRIQAQQILRELIIDGIWLGLVVYYSGRSENPFIYYFLVLIAIGSTALRARHAWLFSLTGIVVYSAFLYLDINHHFDHIPDDYQFHLLGMWINFCGSSLVACYFISKLAASLRSHQAQLSRAREETLRNEQLIGIGTLATSTVHALGTPLSTLTVLLGEMRNDSETVEKRQDIDLMLGQISRCKDTMKKLSLLAEQENGHSLSEPVYQLAESLREHYAIAKPRQSPNIRCSNGCTQRELVQSLLLRHALINLIDNAIEAAHSFVSVEFYCRDSSLLIAVTDDGPGMAPGVLERWGKLQRSSKKTGLGIGVFLANSTIEKLGGTVAIEATDGDTAAAPDLSVSCGQTRVLVTLPLAV
jgi:two-component system sensor histidine kinase RegB